MKNPEAIIISAYIPNRDGTKYLAGKNGGMPSKFFTDEHRTYEDTLGEITQEILGTHGKIDRRLPEKEAFRDHIVYKTNAIGEQVIMSAQYDWLAIEQP